MAFKDFKEFVKSIFRDPETRIAWLFLGHVYFLYCGIISLPGVLFSYKLIVIGVSGMISIVVIREWAKDRERRRKK